MSDWKPEEGKTAWIVNKRNCNVKEVMVRGVKELPDGLFMVTDDGPEYAIRDYHLAYPTPDAARAAIPAYTIDHRVVGSHGEAKLDFRGPALVHADGWFLLRDDGDGWHTILAPYSAAGKADVTIGLEMDKSVAFAWRVRLQ